MTSGTTVEIVAVGLNAEETLRLEGCIADPLEIEGGEIVVKPTQSGSILAETAATAYAVMVTGLALDYVASLIIRIRRLFDKCTVFDFRNNTLLVTKHSGAGEFSGKCIVVGPNGEVTISDDKSHSEIVGALRQVTAPTQ